MLTSTLSKASSVSLSETILSRQVSSKWRLHLSVLPTGGGNGERTDGGLRVECFHSRRVSGVRFGGEPDVLVHDMNQPPLIIA